MEAVALEMAPSRRSQAASTVKAHRRYR